MYVKLVMMHNLLGHRPYRMEQAYFLVGNITNQHPHPIYAPLKLTRADNGQGECTDIWFKLDRLCFCFSSKVQSRQYALTRVTSAIKLTRHSTKSNENRSLGIR